MRDHGVVGILLAAGKSTRFGSDKLLHPLPDGMPMIVPAARTLRLACERCISVLRPEQHALGALLSAEGFAVHYSAETNAGMGHSLAAAVRASPAAIGWVVALADMPLVKAATVVSIMEALQGGASLAAPFFQGRRGHPVGFSACWFEALACLSGDRGARQILAEHAGDLHELACDDPGVLADIDTQDALDALLPTLRSGPESLEPTTPPSARPSRRR
ncbi:MAG: nucleotidyltransferase family protein [Zoogloea sp.]|nr:nucleotidyltransferase family protein [Zoogloea sp.]